MDPFFVDGQVGVMMKKIHRGQNANLGSKARAPRINRNPLGIHKLIALLPDLSTFLIFHLLLFHHVSPILCRRKLQNESVLASGEDRARQSAERS